VWLKRLSVQSLVYRERQKERWGRREGRWGGREREREKEKKEYRELLGGQCRL
jgi:hypothetical protein